MSSFTGDRISVTKTRNNIIIAHHTQADLCMLSDFEEFKDELNIVNKVFVTLGKPMIYKGYNVIIRDTTLLAPGGSKSLAKLGEMYDVGNQKIDISNEYKSRMDQLLVDDEAKFCQYAMQDAVITLIHGN